MRPHISLARPYLARSIAWLVFDMFPFRHVIVASGLYATAKTLNPSSKWGNIDP
jgi:hypothetical protein